MVLRVAHEQFVDLDEVRAADNCPCVTPNDPDDTLLGEMIDAGSDAIAQVTGMRVAGRRQLVARPCRTEGGCMCECCGLDAIPLGDMNPVVDEIKIDGTVVDSATYELHPSLTGWQLVKVATDATRPTPWPSYQQRWKPDTLEDTFAIQFTVGTWIEERIIKDAALEIVCDLAASHESNRNALDPSVTTATIGNVTMTLTEDQLERVRTGQFGPATARMMGLFAPTGMAFSTVWAPELMSGWDLGLRLP